MPLDAWMQDTNKLSDLQTINVTTEVWQNYLVTQQNAQCIAHAQQVFESAYLGQVTARKPDPSLSDFDRKRQALRLLQEARERLAQPGVWIQGHDRVADANIPGGYRFCARGVVVWLTVRLDFDHGAAHQAMRILANLTPGEPGHCEAQSVIANFNDRKRTTLSAVLAWFDAAVKVAETQLVPAMA